MKIFLFFFTKKRLNPSKLTLNGFEINDECTACAPYLDETYSLTVILYLLDLVRGVLLFTF